MYKITYPSGRAGWARAFRGRVAHINRWNDTYASSNPVFVTSNGAGGTTVSGGGISVSTVRNAEYWLENDQGEMRKISMDLDAAPGNEIIAVFGDVDHHNFGGCIYWYNINTRQYYIGQVLERMWMTVVEQRFILIARIILPCLVFWGLIITQRLQQLPQTLVLTLFITAVGWVISAFVGDKAKRVRMLGRQLDEIRQQFQSQTSRAKEKITAPPPLPVTPPPLPQSLAV